LAAGRSPEWGFYHLTGAPLERAAGPLLAKCLEKGWRVLAVSTDPVRRTALDETLWTFDEHAFLPHACDDAEGSDPARQPILISAATANRNTADAVFLMDGVSLAPDAPFARCMVMFDDADKATRTVARAQFKAAKSAGLTCRYFQQTPKGGWKEAGSS